MKYFYLNYADDLAVAGQARNYRNVEVKLETDYQTIHKYFQRWCFKSNTTKTVSSLFYFNNYETNINLDIKMNNSEIPLNPILKYVVLSF